MSFPRPQSCKSGSALISTMLVIAVLTIIVVAFLQSMTVEQKTARSYMNRYRADLAAQAALNEVMSRLQQGAGNSEFHYAIATEHPDSKDEYLKLIPKILDKPDADTANEIALAALPNEADTNGTVDIQLTSDKVQPPVKRTTAWKMLLAPAKKDELSRYTFWTGEETGKQDLQVHSGIDPRKQAEDLQQIPLVKTGGDAFSENDATQLQLYQNSKKLSDRKSLPTVTSANQIISPSIAVNDRDFTLQSSTAILTPEGKPRLNLTRLKAYIDGGTYQEVDENSDPGNLTFNSIPPPVPGGLPLTQGPNSQRFTLVKELLNEDGKHGAEDANPWGPGNLEIVKKIFPETNSAGDPVQARQFVANLIDYIDEDIVPTTDGEPGPDPGTGAGTANQGITFTLPTPPRAPTVLGVEARYDAALGIIGHPYVTYVGQGFIFNYGSARINSSRVLGWVGMAYPWDADITWRKGTVDSYRVEMQVALGGTVVGSRGSDVMASTSNPGYFQPNWLAQKSGSFNPPSPDALDAPNAIGKAHSYFIFPRAAANGYDLGSGYFTINEPTAGLKFQNLSATIQTLRVIYKIPGDAARYLVQDLSTLSSLPRSWTPTSFTPSASQYKVGGTYGQQDWHFTGDPRLNFLPTGWSLASTTGTNLSQGTGPVKAASGNTDYYAAVDNKRKDPIQDLNGNADKWWGNATANPGLANHFMVKDASRPVNPIPSPDIDQPAMHSYAELGFIHAGKPWQTLTLFNDGTRFADKETLDHADWKLLDYIDLGIQPRHGNPRDQREVMGQVNVNSGQRLTLQALLTNIPSVTVPSSLVDKLLSGSTASGARPYLAASDIFANPDFKNIGQNDPAREDLVGRIFPALTTHSQKFLVHCRGEALRNGKPVAQVNLVAEVELVYSPKSLATGTPKITPKILRTYYR